MTEEIIRGERTFVFTPDGGLIEKGARLPEYSRARIFPGAVVYKTGAQEMYNGRFEGGAFWGGKFIAGRFEGGTFLGGTFQGGTFTGGRFEGGKFVGGTFKGGWFQGGTFEGGTFLDGWFRGGTFKGGEFSRPPAMAQRSDGHFFIVHPVDGELRVWADCRNFSWDGAMGHWNNSHKHGAETQRILHFLRSEVEARSTPSEGNT